MGETKICMPEYKPNGSEIEGSYTALPDIDFNYARKDLP